MSTAIEQKTVPSGTWSADKVHSNVWFEVPYAANTFTGTVTDFDAVLRDRKLYGSARVTSLTVKDESLEGHLRSPEFFDAERHPEVRFETGELQREGDRVTADANLTIKGITRPVTITGTINGPLVDHFGANRVGLRLETTIDRTQFDMHWNMPLPTGELALSNEVTLKADLTLVGE